MMLKLVDYSDNRVAGAGSPCPSLVWNFRSTQPESDAILSLKISVNCINISDLKIDQNEDASRVVLQFNFDQGRAILNPSQTIQSAIFHTQSARRYGELDTHVLSDASQRIGVICVVKRGEKLSVINDAMLCALVLEVAK